MNSRFVFDIKRVQYKKLNVSIQSKEKHEGNNRQRVSKNKNDKN